MVIDKDGLRRMFMTLGQMGVAVQGHVEDAEKLEIKDLTALDEVGMALREAQEGIARYLKEND